MSESIVKFSGHGVLKPAPSTYRVECDGCDATVASQLGILRTRDLLKANGWKVRESRRSGFVYWFCPKCAECYHKN